MTRRQRENPEDTFSRSGGAEDFAGLDVVQCEYCSGNRKSDVGEAGVTDEAIERYERAVAASFDAAGPYDRLIWIYQSRKAHRDVIRVAEASIRNVHTYPAKKQWYQEQITAAQAALGSSPQPRPR